IIIIIFLSIFIRINFITIIFLIFVIIFYFYQKNYNNLNIKKETMYTDSEVPKKQVYIKDNDELNEFLFSIQDFYVLNPQAYEELIENLNSFFNLYQNIFNDNELCNYYYQIADSKKNNAIN